MAWFTEDDKRDVEVLKLWAEERSLTRPYIAQPATWIAIGTLAISLGANWVQYSEAESKARAAKAAEDLAHAQEVVYKLEVEKLADRGTQLTAMIQTRQRTLDEQSEQMAEFESKLKAVQTEIAQAGATKERLGQVVADLQASLQKASQSAQETSQALAKPIGTNGDRNSARIHDSKGYQLLIEGDFPDAQKEFTAAEDAYNGYHFSYEIARLLRQRRASFEDPVVRKEIYRTVVSKYSGYATTEQQEKLKSLSK